MMVLANEIINYLFCFRLLCLVFYGEEGNGDLREGKLAWGHRRENNKRVQRNPGRHLCCHCITTAVALAKFSPRLPWVLSSGRRFRLFDFVVPVLEKNVQRSYLAGTDMFVGRIVSGSTARRWNPLEPTAYRTWITMPLENKLPIVFCFPVCSRRSWLHRLAIDVPCRLLQSGADAGTVRVLRELFNMQMSQITPWNLYSYLTRSSFFDHRSTEKVLNS